MFAEESGGSVPSVAYNCMLAYRRERLVSRQSIVGTKRSFRFANFNMKQGKEACRGYVAEGF
jgi:hypothetical protein